MPRRVLPNVVRQFQSLCTRGDRIAVRAGFDQAAFDDFRYSTLHDEGGLNNHMQGVARVGNHLLVTGSFPYDTPRGDLFVMRLGSRGLDPGPWGSNVVRDRVAPSADRLVNYYAVDTPTWWHAGSFALLDSVAAVPLEGSGRDSRVRFLDLSDPEEPRVIKKDDIPRPAHLGGVCAATFLLGGRRLLAVWSDSEKDAANHPLPPHLDVYLAEAAGKFVLAARYIPDPASEFDQQFQGLDFIWEEGSDDLYLLAFENAGPQAQPNPLNGGLNRARLFKVQPLAGWENAPFPDTPAPLGQGFLEHQGDVSFQNDREWYNMDAAASAYVGDGQLIVYSTYHFLMPFKGKVELHGMEFAARDFADEVTHIEDAWADLYERPEQEGRRLTLYGPYDPVLDTKHECLVEGAAFDHFVSASFQIPADRALVLYAEPGLKGNGPLVLRGTGAKRDLRLPALGRPFGSCAFKPLAVAEALPGAEVL
jgi:hypothetical protein